MVLRLNKYYSPIIQIGGSIILVSSYFGSLESSNLYLAFILYPGDCLLHVIYMGEHL